MDDRFLNELRRDPDPVFARTLRQTLRDQQPGARPARRPWLPALAAAAAVVVVVLAFALPQVRDTALAFLDLFRVRQFVAVGVDEKRIQQMKDKNLDLAAVLGAAGDKEDAAIRSAGPSQPFLSAGAASAAVGYMPRTASAIPTGLKADTVWVDRESAGELTLHMDELRKIVETLDLRGVTVPMQLDGQRVSIREAPVVRQKYSGEKDRTAVLVQSRSPEIGLPPGADLAQLGEIGLRIMGLDANEARRFAHSIDWRSTVVVPVPTASGSFREVDVNGHKALMVNADSGPQRGTVILWSEGDMVYAVCGNAPNVELLQMANSVR